MRGSFLMTLALVAAFGWPSAAPAETLREALEKVLSTNPDIGITRSQRNAAVKEIDQAFGGYLPSVDLRAAGGYEHSNTPSTRGRATRQRGDDGDVDKLRREATLGLSQLLFDGFGTPSRIQRARQLADSASHNVRRAAETTGLSTVEAYLEVLRQREILELSRTNVQVHERFLRQVEDRQRTGRGREADTVQARGRLAFAQSTLIQQQGRVRDAESQYAQVVGDFPGELQRPTPPVELLPESPAPLRDVAQASNPALASAESRIRAAEQLVRETRSPFYPRVSVELQGTRAEDLDGVDGENHQESALLVMRYNLYRGGSDLAANRAAQERLSEARQTLSQTQRAIDDDIRVSHNAWTTSRQRVERLREYAQASERVRNAYEQQFALGERSLFDLLDSENELFNARQSLVSAMYAEIFGVYQTLTAAGRLLSSLGLPNPPEADLPAR